MLRVFVQRIARAMALLGGGVLLILVAVTCLSVAGRSANTVGHGDWLSAHAPTLASLLTQLGPINGDFEIIEAGVAFAILAFFPWCFINRGHAQVDIFTGMLPTAFNRLLGLFWDVVFLLAMALITWRLYIGTLSKKGYGETTLLLEYPVWWGYAACTLAAAVATVVALYMVIVRLRELAGRPGGLPIEGSVDH